MAGFLTALLAYGRVESIRRHVSLILNELGPHPGRSILRFDPERFLSRMADLRYRFHTGRDLAALLLILKKVYQSHQSVENLFVAGKGDTKTRLGAMVRHLNSISLEPIFPDGEGDRSYGLRFLLADPANGGACKRWNLFLRWMVRPDDGIDCGVWNKVQPSELIVPLDTHLLRIGRRLGFIRIKTATWNGAESFTESLRKFDRNDPVRFDFSLCRLGILDRCPVNGFRIKCANCELRDHCELAWSENGPQKNVKLL